MEWGATGQPLLRCRRVSTQIYPYLDRNKNELGTRRQARIRQRRQPRNRQDHRSPAGRRRGRRRYFGARARVARSYGGRDLSGNRSAHCAGGRRHLAGGLRRRDGCRSGCGPWRDRHPHQQRGAPRRPLDRHEAQRDRRRRGTRRHQHQGAWIRAHGACARPPDVRQWLGSHHQRRRSVDLSHGQACGDAAQRGRGCDHQEPRR